MLVLFSLPLGSFKHCNYFAIFCFNPFFFFFNVLRLGANGFQVSRLFDRFFEKFRDFIVFSLKYVCADRGPQYTYLRNIFVRGLQFKIDLNM